MSKPKKKYICNNCGSIGSKWAGQCFDCKEWDTIHEDVVEASAGFYTMNASSSPVEISSISGDAADKARVPTSMPELDRVLGGGLVAGSAILIGGDPGIGKSTLLLQLVIKLSMQDVSTLYITGEESVSQVQLRAKRLEVKSDKCQIASATNLRNIIATLDQCKSDVELVIIDSIQTMHVDDISSAPGTVSQIRSCAATLIEYGKKHDIAMVLVGHVTKDGQIAGPKVLEHMVDTVLYFEGDHNYHYRILRSIKNRFGQVNEMGVFEMTASGLREITNPSELFLFQRASNVSGSAVFCSLEGSRPMLVEIQALVAPSPIPTPRRSVVGWDPNRLSMILAVLAVRYGLNLASNEVYLSVAGGMKITEPAADLAVAAALISAASNKPLINGSAFFGEIGLSGEVRRVAQSQQRITEAAKLGFTQIISGEIGKETQCSGVDVNQIMHLKQLKDCL